jgi:hypothetical protein
MDIYHTTLGQGSLEVSINTGDWGCAVMFRDPMVNQTMTWLWIQQKN